jgi:hypothetical protein
LRIHSAELIPQTGVLLEEIGLIELHDDGGGLQRRCARRKRSSASGSGPAAAAMV